jgi:hypothetical protein
VTEEKKDWFDDPAHVTLLFRVLVAFCGVLVVLGLVFIKAEKTHFAWERWIGFFALFGAASYSLIVVVGKVWRKIVMRSEDYYDR